MSTLDTRIPPPLATIAIAIAMGASSYLAPASMLPWPWRAGAAALLALAAGAIGPRAIRAFGKAGTTIDPVHVERASNLVTSGVFARTRNPMYVSMALLLASWAAWLGQWTPLLGPIAFVFFITRFQIIPEERALSARFGADYSAYCGRVRRWL